MKKIFVAFAMLFTVMCFGLIGCGDPYANMKIEVSENEIVLYTNSTDETTQPLSLTLDVQVTGVGNENISKEVSISSTTQNVVTCSVDEYNAETGESKITLTALQKGSTVLTVFSTDNSNIKSEEIKVDVITPIESFTVKSNTTLSIATGESLDLNTLDIFNFSPDTNQTEMSFSILSQEDERFDDERYNYLVQGASISDSGILTVEETSLGGMIQILATSKYMPENPTEQQIQNLSKVFLVMAYRNFSEENIKVYLTEDSTTPVDNILLATNTDDNTETFMIGIENDTETNYFYSVISSNTEIIKVIEDGTTAGVQMFTVSPVDSGKANLIITVKVQDIMVEPAKTYVEKTIEFPVNVIRTAKYVTLTDEEDNSVTNGNLNVDVYKNSDYAGGVLGTQVIVDVTPTLIENKNFILRLKSVDGIDVEEGATRNDIIIKTASAGNPDGITRSFGEEIEPGSIYVSYSGENIAQQFVIEVVANANDERLPEVVSTITFTVQTSVGNISLPQGGYQSQISIGDEVDFQFVSSGLSDRFTYKVSNPSVISYVVVSENRELKISAIGEGYSTLTITAKGTGAYLEVSFTVVIPLEGVSLSLPNSYDVPKLVETIYSDEPFIDGNGLIDPKRLMEATAQVGGSFALTVNLYPSNATIKSLTFESSNPQAATIGSETGRIVTFNEGETVITARFDYDRLIEGENGESVWETVQCVIDFPLTVYVPIRSFTWDNGLPENNVEVYDKNSLSLTDQELGKASIRLQALISPTYATTRTIEWNLVDLNDAEFVQLEPMGNSVIVTGQLPLDYEGDSKIVTIEGYINEFNNGHSIYCNVRIIKPQQIENIVVENYNSLEGVYLESAGASNVAYSDFEISAQLTPVDALSKELSYVVFDAERVNGEIVLGNISTADTKIVDVVIENGVAKVVPVVGKKGYAVVRIIPSSLLNMERPADAELTDEENLWVQTVLNPSVYYDLWVLVADGSIEAPFQITSVEEFLQIEQKGLDKNYQIRRDLDFSTITNWTPLGGDTGFSGTISSFVTGENRPFTLSGFNLNTSNYSSTNWNSCRIESENTANSITYNTYFGIFTKFSGEMNNIDISFDQYVIDMLSVSMASKNQVIENAFIGGVAGVNTGKINNVSIIFNSNMILANVWAVTDFNLNMGGIVGANLTENLIDEEQTTTRIGTITNSDVTVSILIDDNTFSMASSNSINVGGVTGLNQGKINGLNETSEISKTKTQINVNITVGSNQIAKSNIGGVAGVSGNENSLSDASEIKNLTTIGTINAKDCNNVGGLVGTNYGQWTSVSLVWSFSGSYLASCESFMRIIANNNVGGAVGTNNGGSIYAVTYEAYQNFEVEDNYSNTAIQANERVGGLVGELINGYIQYSYAVSYISLEVVENTGITIEEGQFLGDIIATSYVGGLVGSIQHSSISNSYAKMSMNTSGRYVGGFAGFFNDERVGAEAMLGEIRNSYAISNILNKVEIEENGSHWDTVSGFVGRVNTTYSMLILNSYSITGLTDTDAVGMVAWQINTDTNEIEREYDSGFANVSEDSVNFTTCYYSVPSGVTESVAANGKTINDLKGYSETNQDSTSYYNGRNGAYTGWEFAINSSNTSMYWADYSLRVGLNDGFPMLFFAVRDGSIYENNIFANTEVTNLSFAHLGNVHDTENLLPTFFKIADGRIVAVYNNMNTPNKIYNLSQLIELITEPEAALQTALLYVISSDESVVSVVNQRTRFEDAQLKFNKTGVVTITVMSAQNFNYQISFQISVIAGFSSFEMHKSDWTEGADEDNILYIKVGEADSILNVIEKSDGNIYSDNLRIIYSMDGVELGTSSYAQFVEYPWIQNGDEYYVEIPVQDSIKHLIEGLKSTVDLTSLDMRLTVTAKLAIDIPFVNELGSYEYYTIVFDGETNQDIFGFGINISKEWLVRIYEGVTSASFNTNDSETETQHRFPVVLTVNTDATQDFINNKENYIKSELYINDTLVDDSILNNGIDELTADDVNKLYSQIDINNLTYTEQDGNKVIVEYTVDLVGKKLTKNVNLTYKFYIYNDLNTLVSENVLNIVLKPTQIVRLDTKHYLEATDLDNGKVASKEISSGRAGLLTVTAYPYYSDFDYITVTSSIAGGDYISFIQYDKIGTNFERVSGTQYDGQTITSVKTENFDGTFYFSTILGTGVPEGTQFAITVKAYKNGVEKEVYTNTIYLSSRFVPYVNLTMQSAFEENIIPRGTATTITMEGIAQNSNIRLEISSSGTGTSAVLLKTSNDSSEFNFYSGERVNVNETLSLYVGPEAQCIETGVTITATVTSDSITGGTEQTVTTLTFYIVDFAVESLNAEGVNNGVWNVDMQNAAELNMLFNITPSSEDLYEEFLGQLTDTPISSFAQVPFDQLGFPMGRLLQQPNGTTFVSGTAIAGNMGYRIHLSGLTRDAFSSYYSTQLFNNNNLDKPTASSASVNSASELVSDYKPFSSNNDNTKYGEMFKAGYYYGEHEYTVSFIWVSTPFSITDANGNVINYNTNDCIFNVEVVVEDSELDANINTDWANILNSVRTLLQSVNTYGNGNGGVWYYLSGSNYLPITANVNNDIFSVSCDVDGTKTYSIKAKTLDPIQLQATLRLYYVYDPSLDVYKLTFKTIDDTSESVGIGYRELSLSFTLQFTSSNSEEAPIAIYNAEGLRSMAEGQHYILANNITLDNWEPLNTAIGSLDGNGYIIYLNKFNTSNISNTTANIGFFGTLQRGTVLKNLIFDVSRNVYVEARNFKEVNFGFIAGVNQGGIITNCDVLTTMTDTEWDNNVYSRIQEETKETYAQTVFDQIRVQVENARNNNGNIPTLISTFVLTSSTVGGESTVVYGGGLVGQNLGYITNSRVGRINGFETATGYTFQIGREVTLLNTQGINIFCSGNVGGIAGYNGVMEDNDSSIGGVISSSYFANGYIVNTTRSGTGTTTGGFVAINDDNARITASYVEGMQNSNTSETIGRTTTGGIYSYGFIGGFVHTNNGSVENSYSNIPIISSLGAGGFVYNNATENSSVKYSYSLSTVRSYSSNNGPFTGLDRKHEVLNAGLIQNCYYLQDKGVVVSEDEKATELSSETTISDGVESSSQWNDPYGVYFVGFAFSEGEDDDSSSSKQTTWKISSIEARTGPQLVQANLVTLSFRSLDSADLTYEKGYEYGSAINPYIIATVDHYNNLFNKENATSTAAKTFSSYARFVADINFNEQSPTSSSTIISGNIQGNGMKVQNFKKSVGVNEGEETTTLNKLGLFESIENGVVSNLILEINSEFSSMTATYVGGLAAQIDTSVIDNIVIAPYDTSAEINGRNIVGALAGTISGESQIENILSRVSIFADYQTIRSEQNGQVVYRYTYLETTTNQETGKTEFVNATNYSYAGGIAGIVTKPVGGTDPTIVNCQTEGNISIYADIVGGVFGVVDTSVIISGAKFIVGDENASQHLWGHNFAGGLVGENRGTIMQSYVSMATDKQIEDDQELHNDNNASLHVGYTDLFRGSSNAIGGLVGLNRGSSSLSVTNTSEQDIQRGVIKLSYSRVNVINNDAQVAGGLIGLATYTYRISGNDNTTETINVRKLSEVNVKTYTGSNEESDNSRVSFGNTATKLGGYVSECYSTGAVYAGGKATDLSGNLMFAQAASGGLVGAMTDPIGSINSSIDVVLLNNNTQEIANNLTANQNHAYGGVAGLVLYSTMLGEYGATSNTYVDTVLFVKEKTQDFYSASAVGIVTTSSIQGTNIEYGIVGKLITDSGLVKPNDNTSIVNCTREENASYAETAYSPTTYGEVFGEENSPKFTSNIWLFDNDLDSNIFPIIALGKLVSVIEITTTDEFLEYMQGGVGGSYLLVNNITITGTQWGDRRALAEDDLNITGQLKGYVGNGEPATISLVNFSEAQLSSFNSLFGKVSSFTLSNINFEFPENIVVSNENAVSSYFGLIACEATNYSNFENLTIKINGSPVIKVDEKQGVGAVVGRAVSCSFTNIRINGQIDFVSENYDLYYLSQNDNSMDISSFGGLVGYTSGGTNIQTGEFGNVNFSITTSNRGANKLDVRSTLSIGGLVGRNAGTSVSILYSNAQTNITINTNNLQNIYAGGVIGYSESAGTTQINNCYITTNMSITNEIETSFVYEPYIYAGGVAGQVYNFTSEGVTLTDSKITIDYQNNRSYLGYAYVGGLYGYVSTNIEYQTGQIANSRVINSNSADVDIILGSEEKELNNITTYVGGIAGQVENNISGTSRNIAKTAIYQRNSANGIINVYGGYKGSSTSQPSNTAKVGGIFGSVVNFNTSKQERAEPMLSLSTSAASCNITVTHFNTVKVGGIIGESRVAVDSCGSYGFISYTNTDDTNTKDTIYIGGLVGEASCLVSSSLTTMAIYPIGIDQKNATTRINAMVGYVNSSISGSGITNSTVNENNVYNEEMSGITDGLSPESSKTLTDMFNLSTYENFNDWTVNSDLQSLPYPSGASNALDFEQGGNLVPVYASNYNELLSFINDEQTPYKMVFINPENDNAFKITDSQINIELKNISRLFGQNNIIQITNNVNKTFSTESSFGLFSSIDKNIIVSSLTCLFEKVDINVANNVNAVIGLLAGVNNGTILNCQTGILPTVNENLGTISSFANGVTEEKTDVEVSTLNVTMQGDANITSVVYVGGLVGQNNGFINICWGISDINFIVPSIIGDVDVNNVDLKYKSYVGGLIGYQSKYGTTYNCYALGRITSNQAAGPSTTLPETRANGNYIGGLMGFTDSTYIQDLLGVNNINISTENVAGTRVGLVVGGYSGIEQIESSKNIIGCSDFSTNLANNYNTTTSTPMSFNNIRRLTASTMAFSNSIWSISYNMNYGLPYLRMYQGNLSTGSGTIDDPYHIIDDRMFLSMSSNTQYATRYYVLTRDFSISQPLSSSGTGSASFYDIDGNGHSITILNLLNAGSAGGGAYYYGLIPRLSNLNTTTQGKIENLILKVVGVEEVEESSRKIIYGSLVAENEGIIDNCAVIGVRNSAITGYDDKSAPYSMMVGSSNEDSVMGAIIGINKGILRNSFSLLNMNGEFNSGYVGGLVGDLGVEGTATGRIESSYYMGHLRSRNYVGGLVGRYNTNEENAILYCYVRGVHLTAITTRNNEFQGSIGAFVGYANSSLSMQYCYLTFETNDDGSLTNPRMMGNGVVGGFNTNNTNHYLNSIYTMSPTAYAGNIISGEFALPTYNGNWTLTSGSGNYGYRDYGQITSITGLPGFSSAGVWSRASNRIYYLTNVTPADQQNLTKLSDLNAYVEI